jgi:DNA-binding MarR family transcriptional regulator
MRRLESELWSEQRLALPAYDVLVQLVEAPEHRLRMTELAERVLLSRSGLTRLVDRLERDGLVCRASTPHDARGVLAVLTDAGYAKLREASRTHLRGIREHVVEPLGDDDLHDLERVMNRLLDAQRGAPTGDEPPQADGPTVDGPGESGPGVGGPARDGQAEG